MGRNVFRTQSRVPAGTQRASGGQEGTAVCGWSPSMGGGPRPGEVFRSGEPRPADEVGGATYRRQADAAIARSIPEGGCDGERAGEFGGGRHAARRAVIPAAFEPRARRTRPRTGAPSAPLRALRG